MTQDVIDLSVIIVNWNSCDFLRNCLESLRKASGGINVETLVVDNASYDGSARMVASEFPEVNYIQSTENLGFSGANNLAFQHSTGELILFLNPDTVVAPDALLHLATVIRGFEDAGVVGAKLLNDDGTLQTSCVQAFPTVTNQVLDSDLLRRLMPRSSLWGTRALFEIATCPSRVEAISGACMMIRREVFKRIGLFTEAYFMYAEDLDLSWKCIDSNYSNYFCCKAVVTHYGGGSSGSNGENTFPAIAARDSLRIYFTLRQGEFHAVFFQFAMGVTAAIRIVLLVMLVMLTVNKERRNALRTGIRKWLAILLWSLGLGNQVAQEDPVPLERKTVTGSKTIGQHRR